MKNDMSKTANTTQGAEGAPAASTTTEAPARVLYEVLAEKLKVGKVIAYRTARVNLTSAQADEINAAAPGTVKFLGI
jgi:hypothetical protein